MFENDSIRRRFKYLLPVYLYTNFTRFVLNTQFFTKPDAFLYSKRYFTFYGTAMLAYKRIVEMANYDTTLVTRRTSLLHNVKRIQNNIRRNVSHNSVLSMHRSRIAHNRLFYRLNNIFRSNVKRLARRRYRNRRR